MNFTSAATAEKMLPRALRALALIAVLGSATIFWQPEFARCEAPVGEPASDEPTAVGEEGEDNDPLEPFNRGVFWFNDQFDTYLFQPIASGYKTVLPRGARNSVRNFFQNLRTPIYVVSDIVQLKFDQAGTHSGRFLINSTIGGLGLFDVAESFGLSHHSEDFGSALGYHGVPEGAYIVLPFLGPSNVRDLTGRVVDGFLNPMNYVTAVSDDGEVISYSLAAVEGIDARARLDDGIKSAKETSVDYYLFIKSTYHQVRQNIIYDDNPPEE